jgi:hypothetical protein
LLHVLMLCGKQEAVQTDPLMLIGSRRNKN